MVVVVEMQELLESGKNAGAVVVIVVVIGRWMMRVDVAAASMSPEEVGS